MEQTRRDFIASTLGAAALAACPSLASASSAPGLTAWLAAQDIGPVYYVHARVAGLASHAWRMAIEDALGGHGMKAELCYGERGGETLHAIVLQNGTKMDLAVLSEAPEDTLEITFRGASGAAVYRA